MSLHITGQDQKIKTKSSNKGCCTEHILKSSRTCFSGGLHPKIHSKSPLHFSSTDSIQIGPFNNPLSSSITSIQSTSYSLRKPCSRTCTYKFYKLSVSKIVRLDLNCSLKAYHSKLHAAAPGKSSTNLYLIQFSNLTKKGYWYSLRIGQLLRAPWTLYFKQPAFTRLEKIEVL